MKRNLPPSRFRSAGHFPARAAGLGRITGPRTGARRRYRTRSQGNPDRGLHGARGGRQKARRCSRARASRGAWSRPAPPAPSAAVGGDKCLGAPSAAATTITNSGLGSFAGSTVSGIDFSALTGAASGAALRCRRSVSRPSQRSDRPPILFLASPRRCKSNNPALAGAGVAIGAQRRAVAHGTRTPARASGRFRLGTGHPDRHVGAPAPKPDAAATDGQSERPGAGDDL